VKNQDRSTYRVAKREHYKNGSALADLHIKDAIGTTIYINVISDNT